MPQNHKSVRVNKYLKDEGLVSRREADRLIEAGEVYINGKPAQLGDKVSEGDEVEVVGYAFEKSQEKLYVLFNKPEGIVSHNPAPGQKEVLDLLPNDLQDKHLAVLGRLDRASRGLMLLSNDGTIVDRLLNPKFYHEKEYVVTVGKPLTNFFLKRLREGIHLEGGITTRKAEVKQIDERTFRITLTEGKKHQIRRMTDAFGFAVRDLVRVRIGILQIKNLPEGDFRILDGAELETFLDSIQQPHSR